MDIKDNETTKKENTDLIMRWVEAANEHDVEKIAETLHEDYEYDFSNTLYKGKENAIKSWTVFFEGIPDVKFEVQQIIAEGEFVVARLRMTGTQTGPLVFEGYDSNKPFPASNKKIDVPTCSVYLIKDGKILKLIRYWDSATMLRQLSIIN